MVLCIYALMLLGAKAALSLVFLLFEKRIVCDAHCSISADGMMGIAAHVLMSACAGCRLAFVTCGCGECGRPVGRLPARREVVGFTKEQVCGS